MLEIIFNKSIYCNLKLELNEKKIFIKNKDKKIFSHLIQNKRKFFFKSNFFLISKLYYKTFLSLLINYSKGVSFGWFIVIELIGRNYNVYNVKSGLFLDLGFSHNILLKIPVDLKIFCRKKFIFIYGFDLVEVKKMGDLICKLKPIDSYKGKGLKLLNKSVNLKMGKQSQYK